MNYRLARATYQDPISWGRREGGRRKEEDGEKRGGRREKKESKRKNNHYFSITTEGLAAVLDSGSLNFFKF